jgi:thiamine pyrophosphate-dependent acetolactate synthase large subunit-like protein
MKGFEAIAELLRGSGSPTVFAVLASTNAPYLAYGLRSGAFELVRTRHEETATSAATAFSRATGLIGVSSVQRGPGLANSVNALMVAASVHAPLLVLVAESPATSDDTAKNVDQRGLVASIGIGFHHVAAVEELEREYQQAIRDARWNGCPQVLSIGDGVLRAEVELTGERAPAAGSAPLDRGAVSAAVDVLERAERPLIVAGHGAVHADCREQLEELAGLAGARVATSLYGMGFFAGHPHNLGLCGGWASPLVQECLAASDAVLAVGASLNRHTTADGTIFPDAKVIHCEIDAAQPCMASSPELALIGDAREAVPALIGEWRRRGLPERPVLGTTPTMDEIKSSVLEVYLGHDPERGLDPRAVYAELDRRLPEDRIVVTDSGRHLSCLPSLVGARDARSWLPSRGYGSVGLGLGAAIGAAAAHPRRPVVLFCGDGGFMMAAQELDTVRGHQLNLTIVILNDLMYGAEVRYLRTFGLPADVLRMGFPDIGLLARAYGGTGVVVRSQRELVDLDLPGSGLLLVDARLDPEVELRAALGPPRRERIGGTRS